MAQSFEDYKSLEDVIVDWIDRQDIRPRVKEFIRFCTIDITRDLRIPTMEQIKLVPITADGNVRVPTNIVELISINWLDYTLDDEDEVQIIGRKPLNRSSLTNYQKNSNCIDASIPDSFARVQGNYKVFPLPPVKERVVGDAALNDEVIGLAEIYFYALPPSLQEDGDDNWILEIAPDLYFYGGMMHAYRYIRDLESAEYWQSKYKEALKEVQGWANLDKWSGGPIVVGETNG